MKINREIQREILEFLADAHPETPRHLSEYLHGKYSEKELIANCASLQGHGLIKSGYAQSKGYTPTWLTQCPFEITSTGLDFLMDDGGLGAILGVVTVKLDANTLMALVSSRIDQAQDLTHDEKTRAKTLLRSAGDQAIRKFVDMLMEKGLQAVEKTPQLIGMLQGVLS